MCGTANEYSLADPFVVNLVTRFRTAGSAAANPLRSDRWSDLILLGEREDRALAEVGYETARITAVFAGKPYFFARATDGTRDFHVRLSATELSQNDFAKLRLGQLLSILPSDETPEAGRSWPAKHAMLA